MVEVGAKLIKSEAPTNLKNYKGNDNMRKYYTIEKTLRTSRPALKKMIERIHGNILKPKAPKEQTGRKKIRVADHPQL